MANRGLQSATVVAKITATVQNIMDDANTGSGAVLLSTDDKVADGIGVGQASRGWQWIDTTNSAKTISTGGTLVIDVFDFAGLDMGGGGGADIVGQSLALLEVVAIMIKNANLEGVAGTLEIIPDASAGWGPIGSHTLANGGGLLAQGVLLKYQPAASGFAVTDGASHRILLTANGGNIDLAIAVLGRHDVEESSSSSSSSSSVSSLSSSSSSSSESSSSSASSSSASSSSISSSSISTSSSSSISTSSVSSVSSSSISSSSASSASSISSSSVSSSSSLSSGSSSSASSQS